MLMYFIQWVSENMRWFHKRTKKEMRKYIKNTIVPLIQKTDEPTKCIICMNTTTTFI